MILILGSSNVNTAEFYRTVNLPVSVLVDSFEQEYQVGHTSPQDAGSFEKLSEIARRADEIYFSNPAPSEFKNDIFYKEYVNWLKEFQYNFRIIINFPEINFDDYDFRQEHINFLKPDDAVFFGCSFTAGTGLLSAEQTYAYQIAKYFNLNCVNLSTPGGSNDLIFEKFSNTSFCPNQLVVVQLTFPERKRYCDENDQLNNVLFTSGGKHKKLLDVYNRKFLFYELVIKLKLILQISRLNKLRLVFWLANYKENDGGFLAKEQNYFYNFKEFVPAFLLQNCIIDNGTDGLHPGPQSNKFIADTLITFIKRIYHEI